nr:hypothetical protein [Tanacetum cinerariifolium]
MHSMGKTFNELRAMLKLHEQTLPIKEGAPALYAIRAGRIQKNQKKKSHKAAKGNLGKGKAEIGYAPMQAPPFTPKPKNPLTPKKDNPARTRYATNNVVKWDYALESAALVLNMVPTKKVDKTPYKVWHGQAPKLSYLKV